MAEESRTKLEEITLRGFKSFDSGDNTLKLGDINVLIGPNGAGKSNVVSFFEMIRAILEKRFQSYVAEQGFSNSFLHYGAKVTQEIDIMVKGTHDSLPTEYHVALKTSVGDHLLFKYEKMSVGTGDAKFTDGFSESSRESRLDKDSLVWWSVVGNKDKALKGTLSVLERVEVFRFHDTSDSAPVKKSVYINDNRSLHPKGENLAAYLFALQQGHPKYYKRIVEHIRIAMPQFGEFELRPMPQNPKQIILDWLEEGRYYVFGPHQISDGSLRFMALATVLLQPPENMPSILVIDEPELGLHPSAISVLASMVKQASRYAQIILATQSPTLLNEFEPEHIRVIDRDQQAKSSRFKTLNMEELEDWLKEYSLSEIWEKNIIGGKP